MKLAIVAARFTSAEANGLRRAMATFRNVGTIDRFGTMLIEGMVQRGYERDFAERCFKQIEGFGSYGFPESHAASFAHLVYISAWIKCHHPAVFACALLNSQPMGFYAPAEIVRDAREHGVEVLAPGCQLAIGTICSSAVTKGELAMRLGLRQVDGLGEVIRKWHLDCRGWGLSSHSSVSCGRRNCRIRALIILAEADCSARWGWIAAKRCGPYDVCRTIQRCHFSLPALWKNYRRKCGATPAHAALASRSWPTIRCCACRSRPSHAVPA